MLDFEKELDKLLAQETAPLPQSEAEVYDAAWQQLLASFNKKQADLELQVEEIYDLVNDADPKELREALKAEKENGKKMLAASLGLCDIVEDFYQYAKQGADETLEKQAAMMWKNTGVLLEKCALIRIGEDGAPFDPEIHTVRAAVASLIPREHVAQVLRYGYRYMGNVVRKAEVVLSNGMEENEVE